MTRPARSPLWLATPSRYADWTRNRARIALGALLALVAALTIQPYRPASPGGSPPAATAKTTDSDLALYRRIVFKLRDGEDYYRATARELRAGPNYPLRPFITFRLPTLAWLQAALPDAVTRALQWLLAVTVAALWFLRIRELLPNPVPQAVATFLLASGLIVSVQPALTTSHEVWASLLIATSLAIWCEDRWIPAVALALLAMLIRETAALYVMVMVAFAFFSHRWREAAGWITSLFMLALALTAHAVAVWQVTTPLDRVSDGWTGFNGAWFYAQTLRHATVLELLPFVVAAPLVALALFGWTAPQHPLAIRMAGVAGAYGLLIACFARLNNFYWGLLVAPVLLVGLAFVPDGLRDLGRSGTA